MQNALILTLSEEGRRQSSAPKPGRLTGPDCHHTEDAPKDQILKQVEDLAGRDQKGFNPQYGF